jgi:hypothetical protein
MAHRLGPIDFDCDAPPYGIVRACRRLGVQCPEDVRWCRLSRFAGRPIRWHEVLCQPWKFFLAGSKSDERTCLCGDALPTLERCTFTLSSGKVKAYHIGQCRRCQTVFWEEA